MGGAEGSGGNAPGGMLVAVCDCNQVLPLSLFPGLTLSAPRLLRFFNLADPRFLFLPETRKSIVPFYTFSHPFSFTFLHPSPLVSSSLNTGRIRLFVLHSHINIADTQERLKGPDTSSKPPNTAYHHCIECFCPDIFQFRRSLYMHTLADCLVFWLTFNPVFCLQLG